MDSRQGDDSDFIPPSTAPPAPVYIPPDYSSGDIRVPLPREQEWATKRIRISADTWGTKSSAAGSQALYGKKTSRFACIGWWMLGILLTLVVFTRIGLIFKGDSFYTATLRKRGILPGLYSRNGQLYVGKDTPFRVKGFSWYGVEENAHVPEGLTYVSASDVFDFADRHDFNAIRVPLSVENIMSNLRPTKGITPFKNPEISGLSYLGIGMQLVRMVADHNILTLLEIHRLESNEVQSKGF
ncbi:endoglucanase [Gracilaria domingensis]|nr:endoglucanase [Gracilaria domingensis]